MITSFSIADDIECANDDVQVIDSDTIDICNIRVRLNGISAAEKGHVTFDICKKIVKNIIKKHPIILCSLSGEKTYNRDVGTCYVKSQDQKINLQELIVGYGCARDCKRYSKGKYLDFETDESKLLPLPGYCR
mgnify:CR=1 FL=1|tara:strand:+ start:625 stop:1023 length:399 start_codon:yes stop_codon:yes gene_type:complete